MGGADAVFDRRGNRTGGARLIAVVTLNDGKPGRHYRLPTKQDYVAVHLAQTHVARVMNEWEQEGKKGLCPVPDEMLPLMSGTFNVPLYGMNTWGDLLTARQKAAMIHTVRKVANVYQSETPNIAEFLAMALGKVLDFNCSLTIWRTTEDVSHVFGRQALPMIWDFVETDLSSSAYVGLERATNHIIDVVKHTSTAIDNWGIVQQGDSTNHPLPDQSVSVWFTDPPYYFAVPYADLSDFFFVWLKRALPNHPLLRDPFDPANPLTPKAQEICEMARWDSVRYPHKDQKFYEDGMAKAFTEGRRILNEDSIGSVVFAHKTTEGWEALLSGMIRGGWTITGSWPIATEMPSRLRAQASAALATSVHLVCRPRLPDAPIGDWAEVLDELPGRVADWMERLQNEGVRGADLVFACVGPALEIFSRYSGVETPDGREVKLPEYLERVWEVVGRTALENVLGTAEARARNGTVGALEEDARLTALFLWTMQSTQETAADDEETDDDEPVRTQNVSYSLPFDVARRFAQPLGIHLDEWESRVIQTQKGVVKLMPVRDRSEQLFGKDGADAMADEMESSASATPQLSLFPEPEPIVRGRARRRSRQAASDALDLQTRRSATTLDRVHAAMIFQASGRSQALRALISAERDRGPDFLRLCNALSALYPRGSEEKRLLDAMLLAVPR